MLTTTNTWTSYIVVSALTVSVLTVFIWNRRRKNYQKVGKINKIFFYPVKSLKAVEITKGKCTELGLEVNGLLDRSFMIVNKDGVLISQREAPTLVLLTPHISDNYLIISRPNEENALKVEIKKSPSPNDKRIDCLIHADTVKGLDCGDEAASWFQSYLNMEDIRLVQYFQKENVRKCTKKFPFYIKLRANHPAGFQDLGAFHIASQASIDDLNSKIKETKVSVYNFRPNILIGDCEPYAEDSWKYMKFNSEAELSNLILTTRCLLTTNDPDAGVLSKKEPLVTLRKYRILSQDEKLSKVTGSVPCFGITCAVLLPGEIEVGNDIFAVVEKNPKMRVKTT